MTVPTFDPAEINHPILNNGPIPTQSTPTTPAPQGNEYRFTVEDLEKARREEKDKVYGRLDEEAKQRKALEEQVQALLAAQQDKEQAEAEARRQAEDEARRAAEAELDARSLLEKREQEWNQRLAETQTDWEKKFEQIAQDRAAERAVLEKERELASLAAYTQQRVAQEQDSIAPQLLDFIGGNSPEEIDASIERAKAKSAEIVAALQQQQVQQRASQRGVAPTGYAPVGPMEVEGGQRNYSADDIRQMSVQEYAKFRQQAGIGGAGQGRGLFG